MLSSEFFEISMNNFFTEHLQATASEEYTWMFNEMIGPK